ncbi:MAG: HNH endonuclease signature motif containing protein, partial [Acidimicrobiales bacterium]
VTIPIHSELTGLLVFPVQSVVTPFQYDEIMREDAAEDNLEDPLETAHNALAGGPRRILTGRPPPAEIEHLMGKVRALSRLIDGWIAALGSVAETNAEAGNGPVLEEVLGAGDLVARSTVSADAGRVRVLGRFSEVGAAIRNGSALPANVDSLASTLTKITESETEAFIAFDGGLAERIAHAKADSFRRYVNRCVDRIRRDNGLDAARRNRAAASCSLTARRDRTGYRMILDLETERGTAVYNAVRNERRRLAGRLGSDHGLTGDQLLAQAAHDLIVRGSGVDPETFSSRPTVSVNVLSDRDTLARGPHAATIAETFDGQSLAPATVGRLCCDATIRRLDTSPDINIGAARASRTATAEQRAGLRALYPVCPISGAPWSQIEVHHIIEWDHGGKTQLSNLVPISARWHHLVHEGRWTLEMDQDRTLRLSRPDGTLHRTLDPPLPINQGHVLAA